ncbi:MAG TPA: BadF/BadG/BcrA/BcrD ATPase family protein [Chthonomonadaceae bacterium]|nr:BadF/BadG/BcrA/BcrD ATPase family protein [Chthonomonadaceae bacterium]
MEYTLGFDGGGTKTAALILDAHGSECGRGMGGPGNIAVNDETTLRASLHEALSGALQAAHLPEKTCFQGVCAGMAGYSIDDRREAFSALLHSEVCAEAYRVEPDYVIAYWGAAQGGPGIVVIAGTGAVAYGRNAKGEDYREDGLGYLLGDRGSGFNLGLYALRYTLRQLQEGHTDALTEAILKHTGATRPAEIMQWLYGNFSPLRVAGLSPVVGDLAETGDSPARTLVAEMARRLRHSVRQIRHKLWMPRDTPVYPLGGLWQLGAFFRSEFADPQWRGDDRTRLEPEALPGGVFRLEEPIHDPVYGAALLAGCRA